MNDTSVNYSKHTAARISKMQHLSEEQKAELLKEMTLSDSELRLHKAEHKEQKSSISPDAAAYGEYYDDKINKAQKTYESNKLGGPISVLFDETGRISEKKKEYLIKMFFTLDKRHANYEKEKEAYTPEQLAIVNKIEKESGGEVKCIVDTNFLKAFGKLTGVDYRGAGVLGKRVIVGDPKDLTSESLLRHEAIHCAQQRDMGFYSRLWSSLTSSKGKQFFGPEKGTPSAVDYGTDNQATDLETYMNQFDPNYLQHREKNAHKKYYNEAFLQKEYKRVRENDLRDMKEKLGALIDGQKEGKLGAAEIDYMNQLKSDIKQYEKMLNHLENDKESRVVLIEPDVLPSKRDKNNKDYDEKAQVWTESVNNRNKRLALEKNLYKDTKKKMAVKEKGLKNINRNETKASTITQAVKEYEDDGYFLQNIKGDRDKSRKKSKQDRAAEIEAQKNFNK